jgi:hypothetical protein
MNIFFAALQKRNKRRIIGRNFREHLVQYAEGGGLIFI